MKKRNLYALAGVAAVAGIGGTLAYFNQTLTAENVFNTGKFDTVLVEDFKPEDGDNWEPGAKVNKDVEVVNTGDLPVVVRVKFKETWADKETGKIRYTFDTAEDREKIDLVDPNAGEENKFEHVYQSAPGEESKDPDGKVGTDVDDSVVYKELVNREKWLYNETDGYYYYKDVIPAGKEGEESKTEKILDSVTLSENVDMGKYEEQKFYSQREERPDVNADEGWTEFERYPEGHEKEGEYYSTADMKEWLKNEGKDPIRYMKSSLKQDPELPGYSNAEYTLTITAQTVQATKKAVDSVFGEEIAEKYGWALEEEKIEAETTTEIKPEETPEEVQP